MCDHAIFHRQQFLLGCYGNHRSKNVNPTLCGPEKAKRECAVTNTFRAPKARAGNWDFSSRQSQLSEVKPYTQDATIVSGPFPASFPSAMLSGYLFTSSSVNWPGQWINL